MDRKELQKLSEKMDRILEQQELILKKIDEHIIIQSPIPLKTKQVIKKEELYSKEYYYRKLKESSELRPYKNKFKKEFNLLALPHDNRVKAYLETKDPSVFDGLRRNKLG